MSDAPADPGSYEAWYHTRRGRRMAEIELSVTVQALDPRPGESVLDVACGTGYFTRRLDRVITGRIVGVDLDPERVAFAAGQDPGRAEYRVADALSLPHDSGAFDLVVSIAGVCCISDERRAVAEIVRVARRRFAIGLLNRRSLLYLLKGRRGGRGGYKGVHWHGLTEARDLLEGLPVSDIRQRTAIVLPSPGIVSDLVECLMAPVLPAGGFMLVTGNTSP